MPTQEEVAPDEAANEPKVRRISSKPPRKSANSESPSDESTPIEDSKTDSTSRTDTTPKADQKRSNRRRRGKGKSIQKDAESPIAHLPIVVEETISLAPETSQPLATNQEQLEPRHKTPENRPQPQKPRRKLDPEKVAKNAWKIFLAEVSEEGVALIADHDARELARRCFRLSEIFLEEEERRS